MRYQLTEHSCLIINDPATASHFQYEVESKEYILHIMTYFDCGIFMKGKGCKQLQCTLHCKQILSLFKNLEIERKEGIPEEAYIS